MRAAEHASHGPFRLFECRYGLAEIIERGVERALNFLVRQGDNGIVWNILSFWRATD